MANGWAHKRPAPFVMASYHDVVWTEEKAQFPLVFCNLETIRKATVELLPGLAVVFPSEGEFLPDGSFEFKEEFWNFTPLIVPQSYFFHINLAVANYSNIQKKAFNDAFASVNGRQMFVALIKQIFGDGGTKEPTRPIPPSRGPGDMLEPELAAQEQPEEAEV
jgi:hypothetical protein